MPPMREKPNYTKRFLLGLTVAIAMLCLTIVTLGSGLLNVAGVFENFGFYAYRQVNATLLDSTRFNAALNQAIVAPDRPESVDTLALANDLAFIRFTAEDHARLYTHVPRYTGIDSRMQVLVADVDAILARGLPLDVPELQRVAGLAAALQSEMNEVYYGYGNGLDAQMARAEVHLFRLTQAMFILLILLFVVGAVAIILLIKRHEAALRLKSQANHDVLTGLKNRAWLNRNGGKMLRAARESERHMMLMVIDLDRFKSINDTYGHQFGDAVLIHIAGVLDTFENKPLVAPVRIGGDEMALIAIVDDAEAGETLRREVHKGLNTKVNIDGQQMRLGASIGVACFPEHGDSIAMLMRNADIALYQAKQGGRARLMIYDADLAATTDDGIQSHARIRQAIVNDEFELYWQPVFNLRTASLSGAEAFLRWNDKETGRILMPHEFLPLAEQSEAIYDIDRMVLVKACAEAARWEVELQSPFIISVNISSQHLQAGDFPDYLAGVANRAGLSPARLEIDITGALLVEDRKTAFETVRALQALGFRVALDDFGRGIAGLQYLAELEVDRLKIDGSFIEGIEASAKKRDLINTIIAAGHAASAEVVAEGVETPEQMSFLMQQGCDLAQGFLFARPADTETFRAYLQRNMGRTPTAKAADVA